LNLANDANLNLTFDGRHTLFFDPFDRLVSAVRPSDGAQIASYTYDALGRRVTRVVNNSGALDESRRYYSSGAGVLEERDGTGAVARQIVTGHTGPLWQILPGGVTHYLLEDPPGSTVALFAAGARGGIVERATYDPYGKPLFESAANAPLVDGDGKFLPQSQYTNTHLFIGMWYEPELGARADNPNDDWGGLYLPRRDSAGLESTLDANSLDAIVAPTGDPAWGPPEFTALALAHRYDPNKGRGHPKKGATSSVPK
jgi:YD repeat-containing protein